ncbi:hypothetical protein ACFW9L_39620 [Streptomyces sp. NPDC059517]|uniref:hypothetical protein n=1 Tax=Streptomyces sp. NPDC059517 TaxID=3346855 RepID=UPI0036C2F898
MATWQFSESAGAYQEAVRQDVKRQAAISEDVRSVYASEAPFAFRTAIAEARAARLLPLKGEGRLAASEYALAAQTAFHLRRAAASDSLLGNNRYRHEDLGYDLPRRLADLQRDAPKLYGLDPDASLRAGDRWAARGRACVALGVAAVLTAMGAACVLRPSGLRHPAPAGRRVLRSLEIIPQPATAPHGRRRAVLLHLLVFVLPMLLPLGQILAAGGEQRALAEASRKGVQLSASIGAQGQLAAFVTESLRTAQVADLTATARELAALDTESTAEEAEHERKMAAVEGVLAVHVQKIAEYMGRAPTAQDRVDAETVTALRKQPGGQADALAEQRHQVDLAERAGRRSLLLSAAAALAFVAEILSVATTTVRSRSWRWWPAAGAMASVGLTAAAVL